MPRRNLFVSQEESEERRRIIEQLLHRVQRVSEREKVGPLDRLSLRRYFQKVFWSLDTETLKFYQRTPYSVEALVLNRITKNIESGMWR
jgi:hypothetical protein